MSSASRLTPARQLVIDLTLGIGVRIVLALATPGEAFDTHTFAAWAAVLERSPAHDFYRSGVYPPPDHLPGDLWVLDALAHAYSWCGGGSFDDRGFILLVKAVPICADVAIALLLASLGRRLADDETGARAARWYLLSPGPILVSAVWGQWDALSMVLVLAALRVALSPRWWPAALPLAAWAVLIKPQLALVALAVVVLLCLQRLRPLARQALLLMASSAAGAVAVALVILTPFSVGLWWTPDGGTTLLGRARTATALYPFRTVGAANIWMVLPHFSSERVPDTRPVVFGLTPALLGSLTFVVVLGAVLTVWWRRFDRRAPLDGLVWAAATSTYAGFLLLTRVHERYLFPVIVLVLVLTLLHPLDRWLSACFWGISLLLTSNVVLAMFGGLSIGGRGLQFGSGVYVGLSVLMVLGFAGLAIWPWRRQVTSGPVDSDRPTLEPRVSG